MRYDEFPVPGTFNASYSISLSGKILALMMIAIRKACRILESKSVQNSNEAWMEPPKRSWKERPNVLDSK
ncbi:hypothetical protein P175DRAFT_0534207 [Aspergillus ochraceoroseus IBT 24754]|uniref:Uncharacterized protein n=1 Tax=Aspergillus ochraceoroseus IBT 24754 TaxID=1392256 RepID=A0A2T5LQA4_9EURO|nr:uncharacterized protein P175DRAFT_0534207 [Aspergillus ochraceoroseus IBT 24754]PTU18468.1 hypothetical protein P175DRAFT_0534207 [Aspergillus ochraceoroseus IBT 24754]